MKIKSNLAFASSSLLVGLSLVVSSVFAAYSVTDNADQLGLRIGLNDTVLVQFMNADMTSVNKSEFVNSGDKLSTSTIPTNPSLEGYVFDGWTTDSLNFTKTTDDFSTKTYTTNVTYYPRFASYGYKVGNSDAAHLANKWDINNNTTIAHGASLTLGTYVKGKTSLENATSAVTIPNAGGYALVCDAHEAAWNASKAGNINNWHIERYLTVTKNSEWNDLKLFARLNKSDAHEDRFLTSNGGNNYYVYSPYDAISVNFGGVSNDTESVPEDIASVPKYLDAITFTDNTSFNLPEREYYLIGKFGSVNWNLDSNYILVQDSGDSNLYSISGVEFEENDQFKVVTNSHVWYVNSTEWEGRNYVLDSGNMKVTKSGIYTIDFHANWDDKISLVATSLYSTFTVTYDSLPSGSSIYVCGLDGDWTVKEANALVKDGSTNTYSATFLVSDETENFQYVISDGVTEDWNTLNPSGNRLYTLGNDYSYTYVPSAEYYYLVGGHNSWTESDSCKLVEGSYTKGGNNYTYMIENVTISANGQLKVKSSSGVYYGETASPGNNMTIGSAGHYNFYFNPNPDSGKPYIYCEGYYLDMYVTGECVGGWTFSDTYRFHADKDSNYTGIIENVTLSTGKGQFSDQSWGLKYGYKGYNDNGNWHTKDLIYSKTNPSTLSSDFEATDPWENFNVKVSGTYNIYYDGTNHLFYVEKV